MHRKKYKDITGLNDKKPTATEHTRSVIQDHPGSSMSCVSLLSIQLKKKGRKRKRQQTIVTIGMRSDSTNIVSILEEIHATSVQQLSISLVQIHITR